MKKVYLHIGPHKTGTTFLQKIFFENRLELKNQDIDYIDFDMTFYGHHGVVSKLVQAEYNPGEIRQRILCSESNKILLSSENFDVLSPVELSFLQKELRDFQVEVIVAYRKPTERLYSWWQEEIKHGETKSFSEYVLPHYSKPYASSVLNINLLINRYSSIFGNEALTIIDFDFHRESGGILGVFLDCLGFTGELKVVSRDVNSGLPVFHIEMIRLLNSLGKKRNELKVYNIREAYLNWLKDTGEKEALLKELKEIQNKSYEEISIGESYIDKTLKEHMISEYTGNIKGGVSSSFNSKIVNVASSDWINSEAVTKHLNEIYNQLCIN